MDNYEFIKFKHEEIELNIRVSLENHTAYLSQSDLSILFRKSQKSISYHISQLRKDELNNPTLYPKNFGISIKLNDTTNHRPINFYDLNLVMKLSDRFHSDKGIILKDFVENYLSLNHLEVVEKPQIIIYDDGEVRLNVNMSEREQTVWLPVNDIATLFKTTVQNIYIHIKNIQDDGELNWISTCKPYLQVQDFKKKILTISPNGKNYFLDYYNLDMIFAIGYRIKSSKAFTFRAWATRMLKPILFKGYSVVDQRCLECQNSILELKNKVLELENLQNHTIVYNPGEQLRGYLEIKALIETAKKEVILIDNYLGHKYDDVLFGLKQVKKTIITNVNNSKIESNDNYKVIKLNLDHDRFVIVDDTCYHFGASLEDIGKKRSFTQRIQEKWVIDLLKSLIKEL